VAVGGAFLAGVARQLGAERSQEREILEQAARADEARVTLARLGLTEPLPGTPPPPELEACLPHDTPEDLAFALRAGRCPALETLLATYPPAEPATGRALMAAVSPRTFLTVTAPAPLVLAWYAGQDPGALREHELLVLASATARLLGSGEADRERPEAFARRALAGLRALRDPFEERCGACAPSAGPLPAASAPGGIPASVEGERIRRSSAPGREPASPLGALVGAIRLGEVPRDIPWAQAGRCGMAALELARAGRIEALPEILAAAATGPTPMDRLATLWAAATLSDPATWPAGAARARARTLDLAQGVAAR
jgi:hypothetical protein